MSKRLKFFLGHLCISLFFAAIVLILIFFVWYPMPLDQALGVRHLIVMMIIIDVCIGPIFAWFVYKEGKKSLKFDLTVVILLQISAFVYGFYSLAKGRPAWVVYETYAFHIVKASDISVAHLDSALPEYRHASWFGPKFVSLQTPPKKVLLKNLQKNTIAMDHPMYYRSLNISLNTLKNAVFPLEQLYQYNSKSDVDKFLNKYPVATGWLSLSGSGQDMVVLMKKETGEVIKIVNLRPWK